jgi:tetratricopeptide (TPR) repeat protein
MSGNNQQNGLELVRAVSSLMNEGRFLDAERLLLRAQTRAEEQGSTSEQELVIAELISLYCVGEPKRLSKAEELSAKREAIKEDAASRLQTAMLFYYSMHDYERTVAKTRDAIALGRSSEDSATTYTSLSMLGLSLLKLNRVEDALQALGEIEAIASGSKGFVVGDETSFLEALSEQGLAQDRVSKLASLLAPRCRNPIFREKLLALSRSKP